MNEPTIRINGLLSITIGLIRTIVVLLFVLVSSLQNRFCDSESYNGSLLYVHAFPYQNNFIQSQYHSRYNQVHQQQQQQHRFTSKILYRRVNPSLHIVHQQQQQQRHQGSITSFTYQQRYATMNDIDVDDSSSGDGVIQPQDLDSNDGIVFEQDNDEGSTTQQRKKRIRRKIPISNTQNIETSITTIQDDDNDNDNIETESISNVNEKITTNSKQQTTTTTSAGSVVSIPVLDIRTLVQNNDSKIISTSNDDNKNNYPNIPKLDTQSFISQQQKQKQQQQQQRIDGNQRGDSSSNKDELLVAQILSDVQEMRSMERKDNNNNNNQLSNERTNGNNNNAMDETISISKILSTIVTIDFFIVLLFFFWFILGIISSSILKDDTIQIAFNSNFQTLVQPALGILMIASISDAIFKKTEEK
jgi:hypothetical protein